MTTITTTEIKKLHKTLKVLSSVFLFLAYVIAILTLIGTIYLIATPRGLGGWILPAFTFGAGFILFLFLYAFAKIISALIEISNR